MAGKRQHYIPKFLQRGFLAEKKGKKEFAFCYQAEGNVFKTDIENIGVGTYFYSELSDSGDPTLDDEITEYEPHIANLVKGLRGLPHGAQADPHQVGDVLGHLAIRSAHLRGSMSGAFSQVLDGVQDFFSSDDQIASLLGANEDEIPAPVVDGFSHQLNQFPYIRSLGIPDRVLTRLIWMCLQERQQEFADAIQDQLAETIHAMKSEGPSVATRSHKRALSESYRAEAWAKKFAKLDWCVAKTDYGLLLPDCIAIGIHENGVPYPVLFADEEELAIVLFPVSTHTLLVGTCSTIQAVNAISDFNEHAAMCANQFFISAQKNEAFSELVEVIGTRTTSFFSSVTSEAIADFWNKNKPTVVSSEDQLSSGDDQNSTKSEITQYCIPVSLSGFASNDVAEKVQAQLVAIIENLASVVSLRRVAGISIVSAYDEEKQIYEDAPIPDNDVSAVGVVTSYPEQNDGFIKHRIIIRASFAEWLISDQEYEVRTASALIVAKLFESAVLDKVEEVFPGLLSQAHGSWMTQWLFSSGYSGVESYLCARLGGNSFPEHKEYLEDILELRLRSAAQEIVARRLDYREHGDLDQLFGDIAPHLRSVLSASASVVALAETRSTPTIVSSSLDSLLKVSGLRSWIEKYREDLELIWARYGRWQNANELTRLSAHVERLLFQFGIVMWENEDGKCQVSVPIATDAVALGLTPVIEHDSAN